MPDVFTWVEPNGATTPMPIFDPKIGLGLPPVELATDRLGGTDGELVRNVRYGPAEMDLTFGLVGDDRAAVLAELRAWSARLNPKGGEGRLRYLPHGAAEARERAVRYAGGLDELAVSDPCRLVTSLLLIAHDPYWRDVNETSTVFAEAAGSNFFPFPPLALSQANLFGESTVVNTGDVEAQPRWTIEGPVTSFELNNDTTGDVLVYSAAVALGETVFIDTRTGRRQVTNPAGDNLYGNLDAGSTLWHFAPGGNALRIEAAGSDVNTKITLAYRRRYLTA